ncbi:hypothetical protein LCGC14_0270530 [marine sediment metagenome]|uniref:Uncharacterized protein n=1 Tax=marine sediment metagenome TaxID=412755 RepID=A0A0F9U3J9_9ZZZZ
MAVARKEPGTKADIVNRLKSVGALLMRKGISGGAYFSGTSLNDIASQRDTKDHFAERLRNAANTPQVITVRARKDEPERTYMIVELDKITNLAESLEVEEDFETISEYAMRIIGDDPIPPARIPKPRKRQAPPRMNLQG